VIGSILRPASYCGCYGFKPTVGALNRGGSYDGLSQSAHGTIAASLPEAWLVAAEIARRAGGDPGFPGLYGPLEAPAPVKPGRVAVLETDGWAIASDEAKAAFAAVIARLKAAGVALADRRNSEKIAAAEDAIAGARQLSMDINAWESRWPINTYAARDAGRLSQSMRDRLAQAEAMTLDDYRALIADRARRRAVYHALAAECDSCIALTAPGAAPLGLGSTGNPIFVVPASMLGVPALTLPALTESGLPLGLQLVGFADGDAALFAAAGAVLAVLQPI